ncbi:MAG: TIGR01212 family radical SAM protein [bacterium]
MESRYRRYSTYLRQKFGCRVYRIPIDAGFTCPTRDGTISRGGCAYCDPKGSASTVSDKKLGVREQMLKGMEAARKRYKAEKFIAYFQAFTNTYAPIDRLKQLYNEATSLPGVVGLSIGTRPDCVPDEALDLIASFTPRLETWVEYGLQSAHDSTLTAIGRGHTVAQFSDAVRRTTQRGIKACAHVILGLPGETGEMMKETARFVAALPVGGVKIHLFHILKNSLFEAPYREGKITLLSQEEYVTVVCDFIELLPPEVVIQRLTGEAPRANLVAPLWALDKHTVLDAINAELERRDSRQGMYKQS